MSYILEALKKAQAERQLGSAPTIHAMPIQATLDGAAGPSRMPVLVGALLGVIAIGAGGAIYWKGSAPAVAALPVAAQPVVVAPVAAPPAVVPPLAAPGVQAPAQAQAQAPAPLPAPARPAAGQAAPAAAKSRAMPAVEAPRVAKVPVAIPAPAPIVEAAEEHYPLLRELPEAIQQAVPRVAIGGYIYSNNPADRLLLVDKVLRREGEDVGSGQILEKLQSKAAVMNYRGTRYRIPY